MNKNILYLIIFLLYNVSFYSQKVEICGEITYNHIYTYDSGYTNKAEFLMKFNADVSFAEQINIKPTKQSKFDYNGEHGNERNYVQEVKAGEKMFYYNSKEGFYFLNYLDSTPLLVKEDDFNWQWEITDETKKIGDFDCQKATTSFRGNKYEAWFTSEIPVSYGPWKFNGLPGLILEVLSENKVFYFAATNIKIDQKNECDITVDTQQFKKTIDIKNYVLQMKKINDRVAARLSSLQPKGSEPITFLDENDCDDCILLERFKSEK